MKNSDQKNLWRLNTILKRNRTKWFMVIIIVLIVLSALWYFNPLNLYSYGEDKYYTMLVDDIESDFPRYRDLSEYEKINLLRRYVYTHTYMSSGSNSYLDVHDDTFDDIHMDEYAYELTHMNSRGYPTGGMMCGGISWALMTVYRVMGYESVLLDMAIFDEDAETVLNSHVVCLVRFNGQWIVEDPILIMYWKMNLVIHYHCMML